MLHAKKPTHLNAFSILIFKKRKKENKNQEDMQIFLKRTLGQYLDFSTNYLLIIHYWTILKAEAEAAVRRCSSK